MIAKYMHSISLRKDKPFIGINCASIPSELFESELFGYSKGAFTGASNTGKKGLPDSSTLFLDYESYLVNEAYQKCGSSRKMAQHLAINQTKANNLIRKYIVKE